MIQNKVKLFYNGNFFSPEKKGIVFNALIVENGKIKFRGSKSDAINFLSTLNKNSEFEKIDLNNSVIIPSFFDAHVHIMHSIFDPYSLNVIDLKSFDDISLNIKKKFGYFFNNFDQYKNEFDNSSKFNKNNFFYKNKLILINGFDKNCFLSLYGSKFKIKFHEFLKFYDNKKIGIILYFKDFHTVVLNDTAMRKLELDVNTVSILRNYKYKQLDNNEFRFNSFVEDGVSIINNKLYGEVVSNKESIKSIFNNFKSFLFKNGITGVCDCAVSYKDSIPYILSLLNEEIKGFDLAYTFPYELIKIKGINESIKLYKEIKENYLNIKEIGVKFIYDGTLGSQTALIDFEFKNNGNGIRNYDKIIYKEIVEELSESRIGIITHCIGNLAVKEVVEVYKNLDKDILKRIEHAQMLDNEIINSFYKFNIIPVMQPVHIDGDILPANSYIKNKIYLLYRFKTLLDNGVEPAFSTDYPIEKINPFFGIFSALTHAGHKNFNILNKKERISFSEALRFYTYNSAKVSGFKRTGLLKEGFWANFIVLRDNRNKKDFLNYFSSLFFNKEEYKIDKLKNIIEINIDKTYYKGVPVYSRS